MFKLRYTTILLLLLLTVPGLSQTTIPIKVMTYNTSDASYNWDTRKPYLEDVISSVNPDIIVAVEINNSNSKDFLDNVLNAETTTYSMGTFIPNVSSISPNSNCLYYKTSEFDGSSFSNDTIHSYLDLTGTTQYRDINKFTITQNGGETIIIYAAHLESDGHNGNTGSPEHRSAEISYLLTYLDHSTLPTDNYIVLGDFNVNDADELAYKNLLDYPSNGLNGYFYDPQNNPPTTFGGWNGPHWGNSLSYSADGLYARYDFILMSENVWNGSNGIVYHSGSYTVVGNPSPTSDEKNASDHIPVYATFDFNNNLAPVELASFTGNVKDGEAVLKWNTATEVNNYGFEIQRSNPPLSPLPGGEEKGWVDIGFVSGHGNSNSPKNYSFVDKSLPAGTIYYRLKQMDNDGKFEYSSVIELDNETLSEPELLQNYPNPFNPVSTIEYAIPKNEFVSLKVYDILGKEVSTLVNGEQNAGKHQVSFDGANLSSGIYFYVLSTDNFVLSKKMNLLK